MIDKNELTIAFLRELDLAHDKETVKRYSYAWWVNNRTKDEGGLRLTTNGFNMLKAIDLATYEIPFPEEMQFNSRTLLYLDRFIDCPYYITKNSIVVTSEKKATELSLFAGDVQKYGYNKAKNRADRNR
jgi:hypothetical protein